MFVDFIGKKFVAVESERRKQIEQTGIIHEEEIDSGREVTVEFMVDLIQRAIQPESEKLVNIFFCFKNKYSAVGYHDFNRFKKQLDLYLSWEEHYKKLKGDEFNDVINEELKYWKNTTNEIKEYLISPTPSIPEIRRRIITCLNRLLSKRLKQDKRK